MIKEFNDISADINKTVDVCVIGSGAGGAVVAKELAQKGFDVALLEEGSRFTTKNFNQDPGDMMAMMYRDSGFTVALGLPPVSITLGKAVGGTTTINSATCFRTPEHVVHKWVDRYDCAGLSHESLIPYFEKVEKEINVVELTEDILGNAYQVVKRGAARLGIEARPLKHNVKGCEGAGVCQWGCVKSAKQSTDVSYIPKADAAGASIYANCRAKRAGDIFRLYPRKGCMRCNGEHDNPGFPAQEPFGKLVWPGWTAPYNTSLRTRSRRDGRGGDGPPWCFPGRADRCVCR
ncbi:MAG: hypothetical protein B5M56_08465 [Desulfococcus sp. 4484_241]|nr:MAG: hypothetical protein B5M56_08465 [Desulfococcus sp. 4484_241]